MNNKLYFVLPLLVAALVASCRPPRGGQSGEDNLPTEILTYTDSVTKGECQALQTLLVEYPTAECNTILADSIRAWVKQELQQCAYPIMATEDLPIAPYTGDITDGQAMLKYYGSKGLENMTASISGIGEELLFPVNYSNDYGATIEARTPAFVTYDIEYGIYTGGAHGLEMNEQVTFCSKDGRRMGWNLVDTLENRKLLTELILDGLAEYFAINTDDPDADVWNYMQLYDDPETPDIDESSILPLPSTAPSLTNEGIRFVYQQYEIACYAIGRPECIIPYDKAKPILSREAKKLLAL